MNRFFFQHVNGTEAKRKETESTSNPNLNRRFCVSKSRTYAATFAQGQGTLFTSQMPKPLYWHHLQALGYFSHCGWVLMSKQPPGGVGGEGPGEGEGLGEGGGEGPGEGDGGPWGGLNGFAPVG